MTAELNAAIWKRKAHHGRGRLATNAIPRVTAATTKLLKENRSFCGSIARGYRDESPVTAPADMSVL
jgi:hypothetical protein